MKKNYLGGTLMLLLIACGATLQHTFTNKDLIEKSTLQNKSFSNVDLQNKKLPETGSVPESTLATIYSSIAARE